MAAKGKVSKVLVWGLMGLLFVGLAGFGAVNLSGNIRTVGEVGDKSIDVQTYARALQNGLNRLSQQSGQAVSFRDAQAMGLSQQVLAQIVTTRALEHEAYDLGLSIGDEELAEQLTTNPRFQGPDGQFDRDAYRFAIQQAGLSESEFEETLREETARSLLQAAVIAGNTMPDSYADTILSYAGETRDFTWGALGEADLEGDLPTPSDAQLQSHYDDNIDAYTRPELRRITYVTLSPDALSDTIEVEEELLLQAYEARDAEFNQPERRIVERLVFSDEAVAQGALDQIASGEAAFEDVVAERGLELADIDMGDVDRGALGEAAGAVFAADIGDVVGPLPSPLGPALFRVNVALPAQVTPFDEAREMLREELVIDRARREISVIGNSVEDLMAGGATLEEIASETELEAGQIDWTPSTREGIAAYDAFRDAAAVVSQDDFPEVLELEDGGIFALRLDEIVPPAPIPFEDAREQVATDWSEAELTRTLAAQAETLKTRLDGGEGFADLGIDSFLEEDLLRSDFVQGLPLSVLEAVFDMDPGETRVIEAPGRAILVQLEEIKPVDKTSEDAQNLVRQLEAQASSSIAEDMLGALVADIQQRAGVRIDQNALNAVHAQFQ